MQGLVWKPSIKEGSGIFYYGYFLFDFAGKGLNSVSHSGSKEIFLNFLKNKG